MAEELDIPDSPQLAVREPSVEAEDQDSDTESEGNLFTDILHFRIFILKE